MSARPWYETTRRWGQTNLTEIDPVTYDRDFWPERWRITGTQGVIVNAGGIVAYYPSDIPLHYRAEHLGDRDLFGEIVADARELGLAVLARMDCNRALPEFAEAHRDWFVTRADGSLMETQGRVVACVNSPYYTEHIPRILTEIIRRYHPDGFTDNSWTGAGHHIICRCPHCTSGFARDRGLELPAAPDWADPAYRAWVEWSYESRRRNWDLFTSVCAEEGGPDCLWLGMVNANPFQSHLNFADLHWIGRHSRIMMCDHQSRSTLDGFEQNVVNGCLLHEGSSPTTIVPESMAHYVRGPHAFRRASMPATEVQLWMAAGIAGGISPWWHHVGALQEDRRQFASSTALLAWHATHDEYLYDRENAAAIGIVWSRRTLDFYGRDDVQDRCALPWRGFTWALTRARLPFVPVNAADIPSDTSRFSVLVLPDVAILAAEEVDRLLAFARAGGGVVLTGRTGTLDEHGEPLEMWPLAALAGAAQSGRTLGVTRAPDGSWEKQEGHSYLRVGADSPDDLASLLGDTDLVPFGGMLCDVRPQSPVPADIQIPFTFVPPFPIYPPEFAWPRTTHTDVPAVITRNADTGGRVVYLAADIDRQAGRTRLPDHATILAWSVRWAAGDASPIGDASPAVTPVEVHGPGYLSVTPYRQQCGTGSRLIVHIVNLTGHNEWPGYAEEIIPVGPVVIQARVGEAGPVRVRSLVSNEPLAVTATEESVQVEIGRIGLHDVLVVEPEAGEG